MVKNLIKRLTVGVVLALGVLMTNVSETEAIGDMLYVQYWECSRHGEIVIQMTDVRENSSYWFDVNNNPIDGYSIISDRSHAFSVIVRESWAYNNGQWQKIKTW